MRIDVISFFTISYIILLAVSFVVYYRKEKTQFNKQFASSIISGLVLLSYSVYLHVMNSVQSKAYLVILSVSLIQLSVFEFGKSKGKINWLHHIIGLIIHSAIVYFMLV